MSNPFEEFAQHVRHRLLNFAGGAAGADAFDEFHAQMHQMYSMFSPSVKIWAEGAVREFCRIHNVTDPLQIQQAEEVFWFGWWSHEQTISGELYMPMRTDD